MTARFHFLKAMSRGHSTDMSPVALERRLRIVGELDEAWKRLSKAKRVTPENSKAVQAERTESNG